MKLRVGLSAALMALGVSGCDGANFQADDQKASEDALGSALTDETATDSESATDGDDGEGVDEESDADRAIVDAFMTIVRSLERQDRLGVADCAGFGVEARALFAAEDAMFAGDRDDEALREATHVAHDALRAKAKDLRDAIEACREQLAESDAKAQLELLGEACGFVGPDGRKGHRPPPRHAFREGSEGDERPGFGFGLHGGKGQGRPRPPKDDRDDNGVKMLEAPSSEACVAAQADAQAYLDAALTTSAQ